MLESSLYARLISQTLTGIILDTTCQSWTSRPASVTITWKLSLHQRKDTFVPFCLGLRDSSFKPHPSKGIKRCSLVCHMGLNLETLPWYLSLVLGPKLSYHVFVPLSVHSINNTYNKLLSLQCSIPVSTWVNHLFPKSNNDIQSALHKQREINFSLLWHKWIKRYYVKWNKPHTSMNVYTHTHSKYHMISPLCKIWWCRTKKEKIDHTHHVPEVLAKGFNFHLGRIQFKNSMETIVSTIVMYS